MDLSDVNYFCRAQILVSARLKTAELSWT